MKGLLILNGEKTDSLPYAKDYNYIFVADGALTEAKKSISRIDLVVGDFDSLSYIPNDYPILPLEKEKDYTDGEIALDALIKIGCDSIDIYWALGDRFDHTLGNLSLLKIAKDQNVAATIISKKVLVTLVSGKYEVSGVFNKIISLLPFSDEAHILNGEGLMYVTSDLTLTKSMTRGISNVAIKDDVSINVDYGEILVIINY